MRNANGMEAAAALNNVGDHWSARFSCCYFFEVNHLSSRVFVVEYDNDYIADKE